MYYNNTSFFCVVRTYIYIKYKLLQLSCLSYIWMCYVHMYPVIAPITNGMVTLTVEGLECELTYTIIAGGTLNGDLVGPLSPHGTVTAGACPATG